MTESFIHTYGAMLAENYPVCAIAPGDKRPMGRGWQEHPLTPIECQSFPTQGAGVGILCGVGEARCYAIDADIPGDPEAAKEVRSMIAKELGEDEELMLWRVGSAPKFLVPVRGMEAGWKKAVTPWFEKDGVRARVEFLGAGQQFVALGVHPVTGEPYEWHGTTCVDPYLDPPYCLPEVTPEMVSTILEKASKILSDRGWWEAGGGASVRGAEATADELAPQYPSGIPLSQVKAMLADFKGAEDYDTWLKVGMALNFEYGSTQDSHEALLLWDEWSSKAGNYRGFDDLAYRWEGFGRRTGRSVTLRWLEFEWKKAHYGKASEFSETGRAARFAEFYGGSVKYAADADAWYQWDGLRWRRLLAAEAESLAQYVVDDLLRADIASSGEKDPKALANAWKFYKSMQAASKVAAVLKAARAIPSLWASVSDFDKNPRWFGVANGVVDLQELKFVYADRSQMVSLCAGTAYDAEAKCPEWEQTVSEVFRGDAEMADYLQRYFGYSLLGDPVEEVMGIFYGNGANGKSTLVNTIRDLFGEYGHTASADLLTCFGSGKASAGGARADLVALRHKRLVVVGEADQRSRMRESVLKTVVSRDEVSARGLYEEMVSTFRPTWTMTLLTNYMPRIDGGDNGVWRRIHAVPFDRDFDHDPSIARDPKRGEKLRRELPGILNWLLEGIRKYRERGLEQPPQVKAESAEYRGSMDILADWLSERCVKVDGASVPASVAFASWEAFARANGVEHAIKSRTDLTRELARRGFPCRAARYEGKVTRCYFGLQLSGGDIGDES